MRSSTHWSKKLYHHCLFSHLLQHHRDETRFKHPNWPWIMTLIWKRKNHCVVGNHDMMQLNMWLTSNLPHQSSLWSLKTSSFNENLKLIMYVLKWVSTYFKPNIMFSQVKSNRFTIMHIKALDIICIYHICKVCSQILRIIISHCFKSHIFKCTQDQVDNWIGLSRLYESKCIKIITKIISKIVLHGLFLAKGSKIIYFFIIVH